MSKGRKVIGSKANARTIADWHVNGEDRPENHGFMFLGAGAYRTAYFHEDGFVYKIMHRWLSLDDSQMVNEVENLSSLRKHTMTHVIVPNAHLFAFKMFNRDDEEVTVFITAMEFISSDNECCEEYPEWDTAYWQVRNARLGIDDLHDENLIPVRGSNGKMFALVDAAI